VDAELLFDAARLPADLPALQARCDALASSDPYFRSIRVLRSVAP
jgi:hypothetical protein